MRGSDGVLIADVAWLSGNRAETMNTPAAVQPEIVAEVASPRNARKGLRSKAGRDLTPSPYPLPRGERENKPGAMRPPARDCDCFDGQAVRLPM